jgi:hypothetical protein
VSPVSVSLWGCPCLQGCCVVTVVSTVDPSGSLKGLYAVDTDVFMKVGAYVTYYASIVYRADGVGDLCCRGTGCYNSGSVRVFCYQSRGLHPTHPLIYITHTYSYVDCFCVPSASGSIHDIFYFLG